MAQAQYTWEELKKPNKKRAAYMILVFIIAAAMVLIFALDLFGLAGFMADSSVSEAQIRLYGGILFGLMAVLSPLAYWRTLKQTPMQRFEKYAKKSSDPGATMQQIKDTWEKGTPIGRCRISGQYIIEWYDNGLIGKIVSMEGIVWAYKSVTRLNGVVKTNTSLHVQYADGTGDFISQNEKAIDAILQYFMEQYSDVALGSDRQVKKMYEDKDLAGLREYAKQQRTTAIG